MMQAFCLQMEGGLRPLQPPLFCKRTRPLQVSSCRELDVVFESGGAAPPPSPQLPRCLFKQCRLAFKNIAPSRRTASGTCLHHPSCQQRQNPSGRVIKTLCLQVERAAPVTRTVSSTYNCDTGIFQSSKYRPSARKRSPRGPCIFVSCARSLQISSYQQKQNPSGPIKKTLCLQSFQVSSCQQEQNPSGFVIKTLCLQVRGPAPPPQPPGFSF